jgi:CubicO group peptidase (beta-lactamase class C family)
LRASLLLAACGCVLHARAVLAQAPPLPPSSPSQQRISAEGLQNVHRFVQNAIEHGHYLGAVTLIARNGKLVDWRAFGNHDLARTQAMQPDAIFRIYSMTKTITSTGVLILVEEGKFALDDPITRFLPEFARMNVFVGGTAEAPQVRAAKRPITIRHLLTHSPGFAVGGEDASEAVRMLNEADLHTSPDLKTYCERLSRLPLAAEPGERFNYDGVQINVLGRLVEVAASEPFDAFLQRRIFGPLRMKDTGFSVPVVERGRIVEMTSTDEQGRLSASPEYVGRSAGEKLNPYVSGAGGLYSTAADYARFVQMLLNRGELEGVRILSRESVVLMRTNQLTQEFRAGEGFGLGGYVVLDANRRGRLGSEGQFGWFGAASTYYAVDPKERLIALLMMQHLPQGLPHDPPRLSAEFYNLVYQSLE